ncbi:MAG TPA: NAD(P)H-dependent oxidoreductase [Pseudomonadales bacterium]|nr:NAD(P)H-dependent oxidoreductase [Pseudomonadales bacterium]
MIVLIHAHPYPARSVAGKILLEAIRDVPYLTTRSLYQLYPDFDIDVQTEQEALRFAKMVIWMNPVYWYSVPALMKLWLEKVLAVGWAYGDDTYALKGKDCLWVATTGATSESYSAEGKHSYCFDTFTYPLRQTATFCQMNWLEPFIVHGAHRSKEAELKQAGKLLREKLLAYAKQFEQSE